MCSSDLNFDASICEIFGPLLAGARLIVPEPSDRWDVGQFVRTMTEEQVKERSVKSGYKIKATLEPQMPVGTFTGTVTLKVKADKESEYVIRVNGTRQGPLQILPTPGTEWHPEVMALAPRGTARGPRQPCAARHHRPTSGRRRHRR